jgi:hypothetical protein
LNRELEFTRQQIEALEKKRRARSRTRRIEDVLNNSKITESNTRGASINTTLALTEPSLIMDKKSYMAIPKNYRKPVPEINLAGATDNKKSSLRRGRELV